jgi:hypothetical protein
VVWSMSEEITLRIEVMAVSRRNWRVASWESPFSSHSKFHNGELSCHCFLLSITK